MFDKTYTLDWPEYKGQYDLELPIDSTWKASKRRVLCVLETVDSEDLYNRKLLSNRSRSVLTNLLNYSVEQAENEFVLKDKAVPEYAFACINFNNTKHMNKPEEVWPKFRKGYAARIRGAVKQLEPTHVLVFGDYAMEYIMPSVELSHMKRGWVHKTTIEGIDVKLTNSLDLEALYKVRKTEIEQDAEETDDDDQDEGSKDVLGKANLLFYVSRNVTNCLCGRNLFNLSHVKANPNYVDTLEKFDALWADLKQQTIVAVDTETRNLTVHDNALHTIQFGFNVDEGYVLPVDHPETPFSSEDRKYIKSKLRLYFSANIGKYPLKYMITQYGMFDLRILREQLGIPVIQHPVWEISAGEYCCDENLKYLAKIPNQKSTPHGGLEQIFMYYGNDGYQNSKFSKDDRANAALTKLSNPEFLKYCSLDVQSIFGIHAQQIERASRLKLGKKKYAPYFKRLVTKQMSNTVHVLSHMMHHGVHLDKFYLAMLKSNISPLVKLINQHKQDLYATPELKKANAILVKESSGQTSSKGLFNKVPFIFKLTKPDHKLLLFFDVLGLEPISHTKTGQPQVNKNFIAAYQKENVIVEKFGKYSKLFKLWSTYVKGWYNKLQESSDSAKDSRLRPQYGFFNVVTGRLNSYDPSLQQVPSRGEESKYIKRAFASPVGTLYLKFDYSAHEVRVWSYVSLDEVLASIFRVGQKLRQKLRANPTEEVRKELKMKGDIHIQNVHFFFNEWVDKDHPLRDAIKAVVFGVIYGKSANALARDLKKAKEFAADLIKKLFSRFIKAASWLDWSKQHTREHYYTYSPIGMRRNLFGCMTGLNYIIAAMERRAMNSPIQGLASQIGITAARLITLELYKVFVELGRIDPKKTRQLPCDVLKAVHDALYSEVPYENFLIALHIVQYMATYGVTQYYEAEFGVKFPIEPEIEIEVGASEDKMYKWDWTAPHLEEIILKALEDQRTIKFLKEEPKDVLDKIYEDYRNSKVKKYLDKNYPILGVDLD